ncbi:hypothetical protein BN1723_009549 [Verticillium longisporum]|uniref:Uncharacterized protein n=1 Tax=Verticillium longisporum TaxID=100787 RepID=A0A0G4KQA3_VERLO|nr:hypothetical protein BN1723_009549 [Verticillium longisporum]
MFVTRQENLHASVVTVSSAMCIAYQAQDQRAQPTSVAVIDVRIGPFGGMNPEAISTQLQEPQDPDADDPVPHHWIQTTFPGIPLVAGLSTMSQCLPFADVWQRHLEPQTHEEAKDAAKQQADKTFYGTAAAIPCVP